EAFFDADQQYAAAAPSAQVIVSPAPLAVRANDDVKLFGAPLPAFTAAFSGFVNGDTPVSLAGTLAFATNATASSAVGSYPIVPSGVSSPNYVITFTAGTLTIVRDGVVVTMGSSPNPVGFDQPMTFTASVAAAPPGAGAPTGTVQFFDGAILLGSATLMNGSASLTTAGLDPGPRAIEARYSGDGSF